MYLNITNWLDVDALCVVIKGSNENVSVSTAPTTTENAEQQWIEDIDEVYFGLAAIGLPNDTVGLLQDHMRRFKYVTEWYGMTGLCGFGIIFNVVSMLLVSRDQAMRKQTKRLLHSLVCLQTIYMICVIGYVLVRHMSEMTSLMTSHRLRITSYVSTLMSSSQMAASYAIYVLATDSYRKLAYLYKPFPSKRLRKLRRIKFSLLVTVCGSLLFHLVYLPEIRVLLYRLDPAMFDPCMLPLTKQWQFVKHTSMETDLYYALYYGLLYLLLLYALPFYLVACRNKDVIDILHEVQDDVRCWSKKRIYNVAESCLVVSIICNVYLATTVPKFVLLLFKIFDLVLLFASDSHVFFVYCTSLANLVTVFGAGLYYFVFVIYSRRLRQAVTQCGQCSAKIRCSFEKQAEALPEKV